MLDRMLFGVLSTYIHLTIVIATKFQIQDYVSKDQHYDIAFPALFNVAIKF